MVLDSASMYFRAFYGVPEVLDVLPGLVAYGRNAEFPGSDGEDVTRFWRVLPRPGDGLVQHGYLRQLRRGYCLEQDQEPRLQKLRDLRPDLCDFCQVDRFGHDGTYE